ncbi:MAG TPA: DUF932 domain-containing protein, partial [Kineosporiaceae bacterium]|nr:DUF932 domain-containing protein [Kineosporiaceae bacterium]
VPAWHRLGTVTTGCMTAEQVITTARLGNWNVHKIPVIGIDPVDIYLAVTTSHDGSASLRVDATPVRVVCYAVADTVRDCV